MSIPCPRIGSKRNVSAREFSEPHPYQFTCNPNHGVAEHPNGVERQGHEGHHLVPEDPQDLAGEDGQGDASHGAQRQRHPHEELGRPQVLQVERGAMILIFT